MQDSPILITGGAGFIGTNLAARLLERGQSVVVYDNLSRRGVRENWKWLRQQFGEQVQLISGDVRDTEILRSAINHAGAVFHFAAQVAVTTSLVSPIEDFEVNARGSLNVLEALRQRRDQTGEAIPLVFTSTNKVYGGLDDVGMVDNGSRYSPAEERIAQNGISEARPLDFHSPYGCSKGAADQYVIDYARTFDLPCTVFRMSCIYGPHQKGNEDQGWVAHFLLQALRGEPITLYGDGKQVRDLLFVQDLVNAFELALANIDTLSGRAFNMGGGPSNAVSLLEVLEVIEQLDGKAPSIDWGDWRPGDQKYYVSDTRAFEEATGWKAGTDVKAGIAQLYQWFVDAGVGVEAPTVGSINGARNGVLTA